MKMTWEVADGKLVLSFAGELDHHSAKELMKKAALLIEDQAPKSCKLDFKFVDFMDSSGIALILNINKRVRCIGGTLSVDNVNKQPMKVMRASGLEKILSIKELRI